MLDFVRFVQNKQRRIDKMNFWNIFFDLCREKGKAPNTVAKELGISSASITWWKKGERNPSQRTLKAIADYFGISVSYLLGYEVQEKNNDTLSDIVVRMRRDIKFFETVKLLDKASEDQLTVVNSMLLAFNK
jgi:transcriptional regulator with XRE-family HTH domain